MKIQDINFEVISNSHTKKELISDSKIFHLSEVNAAIKEIKNWHGYKQTPLYSLKNLAKKGDVTTSAILDGKIVSCNLNFLNFASYCYRPPHFGGGRVVCKICNNELRCRSEFANFVTFSFVINNYGVKLNQI